MEFLLGGNHNMSNSTANEVSVTQEQGRECLLHHSGDGANTADGNFFKSAHGKAVQPAEALEPAEHALDPGAGRVDFLPLTGGLRHLMAAGIPLDDWYPIVFLQERVPPTRP
jgi:hypothetical protein